MTAPCPLVTYAVLSLLPAADKLRSMFGPSGIIPRSRRLERFTLWPTGIPPVGAMRQRGTLATGFIQQQHFDDATLFDNYFEMID